MFGSERKKYSSDTIKTKWKLIWGHEKFELLGITFRVDLNKIIELNFISKLNEIENTIKRWNRRILTPIGKITVIKSLLISKLNHMFLALPNPPENIVSQLQNTFYTYIWEGCHKIKRSVVTKDYMYGGLKMINVKAFINSLKITWIRRLIRSKSGWVITDELINIEKLCLCGKDFIENLINKITTPFWIDVLKALCQLIDTVKIDNTNIQDIPIFYNPNIKINGKSIFLNKLYKAGINCIGDLFNSDGSFSSAEQINIKYNLSLNFLTFQQLKCAIKKCLTDLSLKTENICKQHRPIITPYLRLILKDSKGSKSIYQSLNKNNDQPVCVQTWAQKLNISIDFDEWKQIFFLPFLITKDSYIQWFQYRIIHRILGVNKFLYKIKYIDSSDCTFCTDEQETIEHLFWNCPKVKPIISNYLKYNGTVYLNLTVKKMLFGYVKSNTYAKNTLLILFKMYIFKCRSRKQIPTETGARNFISIKFTILRKAAIENNNLECFNKDWENLTCFIDNSRD